MKKILMICLLAVLTVGVSVSCANAQNKSDSSAETSGASKDVVMICKVFDKATDALKKDPSKLDEIGETLGEGLKEPDVNQKLTPADKALLKKTMYRLMETVVVTQMEQNPQVAQMMGSMTDDQKKEMIDMAMKIASKEVDSKIDACETLGDLTKMTADM